MLQLRSIYTKTVRSLRAKIPIPESPFASAPIKLSDGSLFISLKERQPSTANCPIIPYRCGRVLSEEEEKVAQKAANKYKSVSKFCERFGVSRSFAINKLKLQKEALLEKERDRIEGLSDDKKRGLILRRLVRRERFKSF